MEGSEEGRGEEAITLPGAFNPVVYADCLTIVVFLQIALSDAVVCVVT